jgi:fluoride exporter
MTGGAITVRAMGLVAAGGSIGAALRYLLLLLFETRLTPDALFPYAILVENILGSFGLGFLAWLAAGRLRLGTDARLLLGSGVMGGFTTYSSFAVDVVALADDGQWDLSVTYLIATPLLTISAALAGLLLARRVSRTAGSA